MPARPPDPFHGEQTAAASGGPPLQQPVVTLRSPGERLPSLLALTTASHEPTCLPCLIKPDRIAYATDTVETDKMDGSDTF